MIFLPLPQEAGWMTSDRVMVFTHTPMETHMMVNGCTIKGISNTAHNFNFLFHWSNLLILVVIVFIMSSVQLKMNGKSCLLINVSTCLSFFLLDMGRVHTHIMTQVLSTWADGSWVKWSQPGSLSIWTTDIKATLSIIM